MKYLFQICLLAIFMLQCAQPMSPTGGDKDQTAPSIKYTKKHYNKQNEITKIEIEFNENIQLNKPEENILINPISNTVYKYQAQHKKLTIIPDNPIPNSNNIYINFQTALGDLNENNISNIPNLKINANNPSDTNHLLITKINYYHKPKETQNISAFLINTKGEKLLTKLNKDSIYFQNINLQDEYKIVLFTDLNKNKKMDSLEINYTSTNFKINNFSNTPFYYSNLKNKIVYTEFNNCITISGLNNAQKNLLKQKFSNILCVKDTVLASKSDSAIHTYLATIPMTILQNEKRKLNKTFNYSILNKISYNDTIYQTEFYYNKFKYEIKNINNFIYSERTFNDSLSIIQLTDTNKNKSDLKIKSIKDTNIIKVNTMISELGVLELQNSNYPTMQIHLLLDNNLIYNYSLKEKETKRIYLPLNNYSLIGYEDANNNGYCDGPKTENEQGEKIYYYSNKIGIKKAIENVVILK